MVALDKGGRPREVPQLSLDTDEEKALYEEIKRRREKQKCGCQPNTPANQ